MSSTGKWHGGKGSQYRPVKSTQFSQNWDKAFGEAVWLDNPLEGDGDGVIHDKCGTPDCCGQCGEKDSI